MHDCFTLDTKLSHHLWTKSHLVGRAVKLRWNCTAEPSWHLLSQTLEERWRTAERPALELGLGWKTGEGSKIVFFIQAKRPKAKRFARRKTMLAVLNASWVFRTLHILKTKYVYSFADYLQIVILYWNTWEEMMPIPQRIYRINHTLPEVKYITFLQYINLL